MEEFLGISFTNRSIVIAHTQKTEDAVKLVSMQDVLYPFPFEFNMILNPDNLELLAERIGEFLQNNNLGDKKCVVSLPMYMAQMKRAALPTELDDRIVHKHLQWEVESLNARDLSEYKVVKLDHSFVFGTYQEFIFALIQKKILDSIKLIAQKSSLNVTKVLLDFDTLLKYLRHFQLVEDHKNQIVFQIDAYQVGVFVYLNGLFYDFSLHSLGYETKNEKYESRVLEVIQEELKRIRSILSQLPHVDQEIQLFATRLVTNQLRRLFHENDLQVLELSLESQLKEAECSTANIEAFSVTL
ncbi:hypothetical protein DRI50_02705 [candidate division KSB1 bacterium]|nr:MAG: hypothetical protein DRI50_02705 [candidate division KSB1 bacterium]